MPKIIKSLSYKEIIRQEQGKIKILVFGFAGLVFLLTIVVGAILAVSYFKWPGFFYSKFFTEKPPKLWAVYLTAGSNPATYYGEIVKWKDDYFILKNPAYIDVRQPQEEGDQPTVTFRRLSDEFYKPKPEAKIFKQNIIFLQELTADSPIYEAYKQTVAN